MRMKYKITFYQEYFRNGNQKYFRNGERFLSEKIVLNINHLDIALDLANAMATNSVVQYDDIKVWDNETKTIVNGMYNSDGAVKHVRN